MNFIRRRLAAMMRHMDAEPTITKDELADLAGKYFLEASIDEIPSRLWIDTAEQLEQSYLRACFDSGFSAPCLVRLAALGSALDDRYGVSLVVVAYTSDREWDEIEAASAALQKVR